MLELTGPGIHWACSMPIPDETHRTGKSYCIDIDIDLKRSCTWDYDNNLMTCGAVGF